MTQFIRSNEKTIPIATKDKSNFSAKVAGSSVSHALPSRSAGSNSSSSKTHADAAGSKTAPPTIGSNLSLASKFGTSAAKNAARLRARKGVRPASTKEGANAQVPDRGRAGYDDNAHTDATLAPELPSKRRKP